MVKYTSSCPMEWLAVREQPMEPHQPEYKTDIAWLAGKDQGNLLQYQDG